MKRVKSIPVGLFLFIILTITSCEKDKPLSEAIIGIWEITEITVDVYQNGVIEESHTDYLNTDEMVFQFAEGGSGIFYEDNNNYPFTWALSNSTLAISDLFQNDLVCQVTVDGSLLILSYEEIDDQDPTTKYNYFFRGIKK